MLHACLCSDCGHVMGRWLGLCVQCRSKNVEYYADTASAVLAERVRQIKGVKKPVSQTTSCLVVTIAVTVLAYGAQFAMNHLKPGVSVAATAAAQQGSATATAQQVAAQPGANPQ